MRNLKIREVKGGCSQYQNKTWARFYLTCKSTQKQPFHSPLKACVLGTLDSCWWDFFLHVLSEGSTRARTRSGEKRGTTVAASWSWSGPLLNVSKITLVRIVLLMVHWTISQVCAPWNVVRGKTRGKMISDTASHSQAFSIQDSMSGKKWKPSFLILSKPDAKLYTLILPTTSTFCLTYICHFVLYYSPFSILLFP